MKRMVRFTFVLLFLLPSLLALTSCSTSSTSARGIPGMPRPPTPMTPIGLHYSSDRRPIVTHVLPGSPAQKAGFQNGDMIVSLNGKAISTIADFESFIKFAPTDSLIATKRGNRLLRLKVHLSNARPKLGLDFEPGGIALIKNSNPYLSFFNRNNLKVYAQASQKLDRDELHLNFIIQSTKVEVAPSVLISVFEKGKTKPLFRRYKSLDLVSDKPVLLTEKISAQKPVKGPILVSLDIAKNHFLFEFQ